jgi:CheY-like chemotaxis protein
MAHLPELPRIVAVLNSNEDLVRLIREALHGEGYLTIGHHIADLRDGHTDISRFLHDRNPPVIIYDLAPPFMLNWQFLGLLRKHPQMKNRTIILVGMDDDLRQLVAAVNAAFKTKTPRPPKA